MAFIAAERNVVDEMIGSFIHRRISLGMRQTTLNLNHFGFIFLASSLRGRKAISTSWISQTSSVGMMEADKSEEDSPVKRCFVTVGATASFFDLVKEVLSEPFLTALLDQGYNDLRIQYGKGGQKLFEDHVRLLSDDIKSKITISSFEYDKNGLLPEMQAAKRDYKSSPYPGFVGCAVSHAGMIHCSYRDEADLR